MPSFSHSKEVQWLHPLRYSVSMEVINFNYNFMQTVRSAWTVIIRINDFHGDRVP